MIEISVVVPVYNEEESVPHLCEKLHTALSRIGKTYEIVLVDDGSTDNTWERLVEASKKHPSLLLIRLRRNFGQTAAMSAGFRESSGHILITMDADLQNDPADIPLLLNKMKEGYDIVSGWRRDRKDTFLDRRLPSIIANSMISKSTGVTLHDYGCTLKAYSREIIDTVKIYGEMHRFIPALASMAGAKIAEVEVTHHPRRFGKTKYNISRTQRVVLDLLMVKFLLSYGTRPIQIFGKIALLFGVPGILWILVLTLANLAFNLLDMQSMATLVKMSKSAAWIITPFMLVLFGTQFISMGILAEIQMRTYHEAQNKPTYVIKELIKPDKSST